VTFVIGLSKQASNSSLLSLRGTIIAYPKEQGSKVCNGWVAEWPLSGTARKAVAHEAYA
jgi:hypothetical protein